MAPSHLGGAGLFRDRAAAAWLQLALRREDFFPRTLRLFDVECRVCLAIFLLGAIDGFKRGVEVSSIASLFE